MNQSIWVLFVDFLLLLVLFVWLFPTESKKRESLVVVFFVISVTSIVAAFGVGNIQVDGPLHNSIMNKDDEMLKYDNYVKELQKEGLHTGDFVPLIIPFYEGINQEELQFVYRFTDELKKWFAGYNVLSLSNIDEYRVVGNELHTEPYLKKNVFNDNFNLEEWKTELDKDSRMKKFLIGGDYNCAYVLLLLPRGYNELEVFFEVKKMLEQKEFHIFTKWKDIFLADKYMKKLSSGEVKEHVLPAGWCISRGLMTVATVVDVLQVMFFGLLSVALLLAVCFISKRQAIISWLIIILSFVFVVSMIGVMTRLCSESQLLELLGMRMYLRIYILFVFTANIVAGISFTERKFNFFNYLRKSHPAVHRSVLWEKTKAIDERIAVTAILSIVNYLFLRQINIRPLWEVGFLSACGVLYLWALTKYFIPAVHTLIGGEKADSEEGYFKCVGCWLNRQFDNTVKICYKLLDINQDKPYNPKIPFIFFMSLMLCTVLLASYFVASDLLGWRSGQRYIEIRTRPLEYIKSTIVHRSYEYSKSIGEGFESLPILIKNRNESEKAYENVEFLKTVEEIIEQINNGQQGVIKVNSIMDGLSVISREESYGALPPNSEEAGYSFNELSSGLGPGVRSHFWFDGGIVLFASVVMDDSRKLNGLVSYVLSLREDERFKNVEIIPFSNPALWPRIDWLVSTGEPENVMSNFVSIFFGVAVWVFFRNRCNLFGRRVMRPVLSGIAVCLPFVFSSSIMIIVMAIRHMPLDQSISCTGSFAVAAAADFSICLLADYQDKILEGFSRREALQYALLDRGEVTVADVLLGCVCFATLFFSSFPPIIDMGWIMILMLLACGFGSLLIMMSMLPYCVGESKLTKGVYIWKLKLCC